jgi:uncharacterized membrane protein YqjE
MTEEAGRSEGLLDSLRNLAGTFLAIVQTRIEIFASEIDEERARLARIAVLAAVAALCIALAKISMRVCTIARKVLARFRSESSRPSERPASSVMGGSSGGR